MGIIVKVAQAVQPVPRAGVVPLLRRVVLHALGQGGQHRVTVIQTHGLSRPILVDVDVLRGHQHAVESLEAFGLALLLGGVRELVGVVGRLIVRPGVRRSRQNVTERVGQIPGGIRAQRPVRLVLRIPGRHLTVNVRGQVEKTSRVDIGQ